MGYLDWKRCQHHVAAESIHNSNENQDERTKYECVTLHFMSTFSSRYIFNIYLMGLFHALMSEQELHEAADAELQAAGS